MTDMDTIPTSCLGAERIDVSVIIPAYNAAATIVRALDSVRAQTGVGAEVIVIDDGSADDTLDVVRANIGAGEAIRVLQMEKNGGVSAARNAGIKLARAPYLAFLDADDIWLPGKLQRQVARIAQDTAISLVSCNSSMVTAAGVPLKEGHVNRPPVEGADAWKTLLTYNFIPTPTVLARTEMVRGIGGFNETLKVGEDLDLWIRLGLLGKIAILPQILINYYDVAGSLMKRHSGEASVIVMPMIERHIEQQAARLTSAEIRHIRGQQAFQMACDMFFSGNYLASIPVFRTAAAHGTRPVKSLLYIPRALYGHAMARLRGATR